jgi:RNA polymerase sigma-70 factor, ECF subfamily
VRPARPVTPELRVQETDPQLIRAAAAGDLDAFEQIVRLHQQHVWRFLRRLLGDGAAAEDVAQETFLRVYRRLPGFTFQSSFSTWLFQVARNAGVDELRARQRRSRLTVALRPGPVESTGTGQARAEIDAALATLPLDLRETLVLVEVLGLRYAEAAAVLGVPVGTVKSRMHAARSRLATWARAGDRDDRAAPGAAPRPDRHSGDAQRPGGSPSGLDGDAARGARGEV